MDKSNKIDNSSLEDAYALVTLNESVSTLLSDKNNYYLTEDWGLTNLVPDSINNLPLFFNSIVDYTKHATSNILAATGGVFIAAQLLKRILSSKIEAEKIVTANYNTLKQLIQNSNPELKNLLDTINNAGTDANGAKDEAMKAALVKINDINKTVESYKQSAKPIVKTLFDPILNILAKCLSSKPAAYIQLRVLSLIFICIVVLYLLGAVPKMAPLVTKPAPETKQAQSIPKQIGSKLFNW